jgi:hypothetical protein
MVTDVQITLEVVAKGLEKFEETGKGIKKLGDLTDVTKEATSRWGKEYDRMNKSFADFMANLPPTNEELKKLAAIEKDLAKQTAAVEKENKKTAKSFNQLAKGVLGVATAYAAGRWLINFAKDSVEAARAAGVMAEGLDKAETSGNRLKVSLGEGLIRSAEGPMTVVAKLADEIADHLDLAHASALQLANVGLERAFADEPIPGIQGLGREVTRDVVTGEIVGESKALERLNESSARNAALVREMNLETRQYVNTIGLVIDEQVVWEMQQARLNKELDELHGLMTPLTGDIEGFQKSIADLREEEADLAAEFGLLEFLTPEQQGQIGLLKSSLTGVWMEYNKIKELIEDEEDVLGGKKLEEAEEAAEEFIKDIGFLEAQIIALGGNPFVTQEQEDEAREHLKNIREEIDNVTAAWSRQSSEMVFALAEQRLALGGFTDIELDALTNLAAGLDLIDPTQVALLDAIGVIASEFATTEDAAKFTEDMDKLAEILSDPAIDVDAIPNALAGISQAGGGLETAKGLTTDILSDLDTMVKTRWQINVDVDYTTPGAPPPPPPGAGPGHSHGADFVVPPGFPNDSFAMNVESGERVIVIPPGGQQARGGSGKTVNIGTQIFNGIDLDDLAREMENEGFLE